MQVEKRIRDKLTAAFAPARLVIENDSHKHAHHVAMKGMANTGETHFTVTIISEAFAGRSRIDRHRLVNEALAEELAGPVHALAVKAATPSEVPDA
jgi:stress-induced morphogen